MNISCDCGSFEAKLTAFPKNTPGRLVCYCKDCQSYLHKIDRADVLDAHGGSEIIPAYPKEVEFVRGKEHLSCYRLSEKGTNRWVASCCNSPIVNTKDDMPWAGFFHTAYKAKDPNALHVLGEIKSRIFGRDAIPGSPHKISNKISLKDMSVVLPFIFKGKLNKMSQNSPFTESDDVTQISNPVILKN